MKEFFKIMEKDILSENFSKREYVLYGVVAPLFMIAAVLVAGLIEKL